MSSWTTHELDVLRQYAHMGTETVSAAIWHLCGKRRTPSACQRQASRMGISTALRRVCPVCGFTSTRHHDFTNEGICQACNKKALAEKQRVEVELMQSCESGARRDDFERTLEKAEKAYAMYRQQKHRLREEIGEEAAKAYENLSKSLSNRSSDPEKISDEEQMKLF